jgi:hypothetical protein
MQVGCQNPRRVGPLFEAVFACALRQRVHFLSDGALSRQFSRHLSRSSVLVKTQ